MNKKQYWIKTFLILVMLFVGSLYSYGQDDDDYEPSDTAENVITTDISETTFKIGKKVTLTTKITNMPDMKILWQDVTKSDNKFDIISTRDYYEKKKNLVLEIVFTSFDAGIYEDVHFTIPLKDEDSQMTYLETKKYHIEVTEEITEGDLNTMMSQIQSAADLDKIVLRPGSDKEGARCMDQAHFGFNFKPYIKIILFVLMIVIICAITFYLLWTYLMKKKPSQDEESKIPPFDKFVLDMEMTEFIADEERVEAERKLSVLTSALKNLITGECHIPIIGDTTRELLSALKKNNFNMEWTNMINRSFGEIDMIKFAKAEYTLPQLNMYKEEIKKLGYDIHQIYKTDDENENEQSSQTDGGVAK